MSLAGDLRAWAGSLLDVYNVIRARPVPPHSYTKFRLIDACRRHHHAKVLVETGTFHGTTAARAATRFPWVFTIELDPSLHRRASERLGEFRNVEVLQGDAVDLLHSVFNDARVEKAVVFLDAHFSGMGTASGALPEPVIPELEVLARHADRCASIVIDDFRSFGTEPGFPRKHEVLEAAERLFPPDAWCVRVFLDLIVIDRIQPS